MAAVTRAWSPTGPAFVPEVQTLRGGPTGVDCGLFLLAFICIYSILIYHLLFIKKTLCGMGERYIYCSNEIAAFAILI